MQEQVKIVWEMWGTNVQKLDDNVYIVNTPISIQEGFTKEEDAIEYAVTYGQTDRRPIIAKQRNPAQAHSDVSLAYLGKALKIQTDYLKQINELNKDLNASVEMQKVITLDTFAFLDFVEKGYGDFKPTKEDTEALREVSKGMTDGIFNYLKSQIERTTDNIELLKHAIKHAL